MTRPPVAPAPAWPPRSAPRPRGRAGPRLRRPDRSRTAPSTCCGPRPSPATTTASSTTSPRSQFAGGGGSFGSIIPLPGVPSKRRARRRLDAPAPDPRDRARSSPPRSRRSRRRGSRRARSSCRSASTRSTSRSSRAAADEVGDLGQGARLPAAARRARGPRLLRRRAARSSWRPSSTPMPPPARGQAIGDGTPVHITIPTANPWVPLRILALGKTGERAGRRRRLPAHRPTPGPPAGRRPATTA